MAATEIQLSIGGLGLKVSGDSSMPAVKAIPGLHTFRAGRDERTDVHVVLDQPLASPDCRWLHRFEIVDGATECRFGIDTEKVYHYTFGTEGHLRFDPRQPDTVYTNALPNPDLARFALWTAYAMTGLRHQAVPIHSSVVVCHGRAVLCLGESGTGKSTHTGLWVKHIEGSYLLNDDCPILRVEGDEVVVYGSPWSGKAPCFRQERVPVAALLRLEQRPENTIRRLRTVESITALLPSCPPALAHDENCLDHMLMFIGGVIGRVPVFRLGCLPDADAARLAYNTIMG